jgi:N4-gp56 family major capsid protein
MAATEFGVNHPLAVKKWSSDLMKEMLKQTYILRFIGKDANSLIQWKDDLSKDQGGDQIRYGLRVQLTGDGVQGDDTAEGNEEALTTYYDQLIINQLRHQVRSKGKMSEQRVPFDVRAENRDALADWWSARLDTWFDKATCFA